MLGAEHLQATHGNSSTGGAIAIKIADNHNISYIDIRSAYLDALPLYRMSYKGCLTVDGEHENSNGMAIIAKSIAKVVAKWQNKLF